MIIRRAALADTGQMAALLNEIINIGGTTAYTNPVEASALQDRMNGDHDRSAWRVAEADGNILGFQKFGPSAELPPEACDIATFVQHGRTGLGIGSALFEAAQSAADDLGHDWINATIRADNEGGLIYY